MGHLQRKRLVILGATGSIGFNTLDVVRVNPGRYSVAGLSCYSKTADMMPLIHEMQPEWVAVTNRKAAGVETFRQDAPDTVNISVGTDAIEIMLEHVEYDVLVNGLVGAVGLQPTLTALRQGKSVALANKETMVIGGALVDRALQDGTGTLIPVDSEHNAIWQCLTGEEMSAVSRILLTASGGPFRTYTVEEMASVTKDQALQHPNWDMGPKITIDSATMMNKGLEVIEAYWLFHQQADTIDVVIHPQSVIHSMVEFIDGSVKAQMAVPDMRLPIQYALTYPERLPASWEQLDICAYGQLEFYQPDTERFPCLRLAYEALQRGGTAPAILNAANEVAVDAFLRENIAFPQISVYIEKALTQISVSSSLTLESLLEADRQTRQYVQSQVETISCS